MGIYHQYHKVISHTP